jgi:hypothetical protein
MSYLLKCSTSCPTFSWCLPQYSPAEEDTGGGCESHRKRRSYPTPNQPRSFHVHPCKVPCFHFCCPLRRQRDTQQSKAVGRSSSFLFLQLFFISNYSLAPVSLGSITQVHLHSLSNAILANLDGNLAAHQNISTVENTRIDVGRSPKSGTNLGAPSQDGSNGTLSLGPPLFSCCMLHQLQV